MKPENEISNCSQCRRTIKTAEMVKVISACLKVMGSSGWVSFLKSRLRVQKTLLLVIGRGPIMQNLKTMMERSMQSQYSSIIAELK